jgi:hypothetical protein
MTKYKVLKNVNKNKIPGSDQKIENSKFFVLKNVKRGLPQKSSLGGGVKH